MVFDPESATHLKPWLIRTLEPICDAEPGALADYILALLKHNVPENEMRQELGVQLDEFLEKECSSFIETLFTVIRTKSYLPYQAVPQSPSFSGKPLDNGIPIPLDALLTSTTASPERTRKRSTTDDERDGRPPAKGPRLNNAAQFSRYGAGGNGGDDRMGPHSSGGWTRPPFRDGSMGMGMSMGMPPFGGQMPGMQMNGMGMMNGRRPQGYQPPDQKRGLCRDYHQNGFCARGPMCKYSHADDAVVPGQLYPGNGMPFMPSFPPNGGGMPFMQGSSAYDPHESRMDMRPPGGRQHQRAPLLPRIQQEDGSRVVHPMSASGELPVIQDLTPVLPQEGTTGEAQQQGDTDMQQNTSQPQAPPQHPPQMQGGGYPMHHMNGNGYHPGPMMEIDPSHMPGMRPQPGRGQFRGRGGGGRGRGTFGGEVHNFRPEKRGDKTLVVEKIPDDKLSLESVNAWFKRFGTVTNVAIDANNAKALVSFSQHEEAHAAWKSEDAVFGNRFVKVFWHRPMEGHGQQGARMLAASAPLVANMGGVEPTSATVPPTPAPASAAPTPVPAAVPAVATTTPRKASAAPGTSATAALLAAKSQLLEQTIAEQKKLMAALSTATPAEKKEIMAQFKKLDEEMSKLKEVARTPTPAKTAVKKPADGLTDHERKERERLDRELETHGGEKAEESAEDLQAKLQRLKEEAASLGLDSPLQSTSYRGGYRGRARGGPRGYPRGGFMRGGPPRASMKLDNRPKKLLVKGVREDNSQALRDWYESTGQLESVEPSDNGSFVVTFKSRSAAEMGLAKGSNIPIVGSVQLSWYTGNTGHSTTVNPTKSTTGAHNGAGATPNGTGSRSRSPELVITHIPEEEVVASGWGGGDDDEDGMGLL